MKQSIVIALLAVCLVGSARTSQAGIGDFIWELSGPQMLGGGIACRFNFESQREYCEWSASTANIYRRLLQTAPDERHWFWTLGAAGYVSTGTDNRYEDNFSCPEGVPICAGDEINYRWLKHRMLSFEPTIDYLVKSCECAAFYLTAGPVFHTVWNSGAEHAHNWGFKIAPEVKFDRFTLSYNLRFYPDGFSPDQFGKGVFRGGDRPSEWTHGIGMSFPFKRR